MQSVFLCYNNCNHCNIPYLTHEKNNDTTNKIIAFRLELFMNSSSISLTILDGSLQGKIYTFEDRTTCLLGRSNECEIKFPDESVYQTISRYHCHLDINPPLIKIRDLGSKYGTYINDNLIGKRHCQSAPNSPQSINLPDYEIHHQDIIKIGDVSLMCRIFTPPPVANNPPQPDPIFSKTESHNMYRFSEIANEPPKGNLLDFVKSLLKKALGGDEQLLAIQGYDVQKLLGKGGFGEVYLARHQKTGDYVALKVMKPEMQSDFRQREKFLREVENTRALNHPHIIQLKDYGFADIFFFTLEYGDGGTIRSLMNNSNKPLPIDTAVKYTLQILSALEYAHQAEIPYVKLADGTLGKGKGIVHRDITPSNIVLKTVNGELVAKLTDFGLSKAFDLAGLSGLSRSGEHLEGTFQFMPKEQVCNFKYAQPDVDLWSTIACLYYMLTHETPRDFRAKDSFMALLQTKPVPIHRWNPNIPKPLADFIDYALIDSPQINYKTATALKLDLLGVVK